jgi:hypothetical protein
VPTILSDLILEEAIETTKIFSTAGLLPDKTPLLTTRPFRSPHHTVSDTGLIGGGQVPRPGEVSPARFMLVAAMNPCACGFPGDRVRPCTCRPLQVQRYRNRLSGPESNSDNGLPGQAASTAMPRGAPRTSKNIAASTPPQPNCSTSQRLDKTAPSPKLTGANPFEIPMGFKKF